MGDYSSDVTSLQAFAIPVITFSKTNGKTFVCLDETLPYTNSAYLLVKDSDPHKIYNKNHNLLGRFFVNIDINSGTHRRICIDWK
jgi:hypothetical protein